MSGYLEFQWLELTFVVSSVTQMKSSVGVGFRSVRLRVFIYHQMFDKYISFNMV